MSQFQSIGDFVSRPREKGPFDDDETILSSRAMSRGLARHNARHSKNPSWWFLLLVAAFGIISLRLHESAWKLTAPLHDDFVADQPTRKAITTKNAQSSVANSKNASKPPQSSNAIPNIQEKESAPVAKTSTRINWNAVGDTSTTTTKPNYVKPKYKNDGIERALFVICMGEKATQSTVVERFVYSARTAGRYNDWIVILTDASEDRYAALSNWTDHLIFMQPREEDIKKHYLLANMTYKRFKTLLLDYMDREPKLNNVELVYYLDADIVIGNPLSRAFRGLERKYRIGRRWANQTSTPIARGKMWMFQGNFKRWPLQGGQIILDRNASKPCLERWRRGFDGPDAKTLKKDQVLLREMKLEMEMAIQNATVLDCELVNMTQAKYVEFPSVSVARTRNDFLTRHPNHTYSKSYSPIVHLKNDGGFAEAQQWKIQRFLQDLLRLEDEEQDSFGLLNKIEMDTKKKNDEK